MRLWLVLLFSVLVCSASSAVAGEQSGESGAEGLQPEDYYRFVFVSDPQLSPDASRVAFVRATVSADRRSRESAIWMVNTEGNPNARAFTAGASDSSPRWSPNGQQLAFSGRRDDQQHLLVIPADGGEARPVFTPRQGSLGDFHWLAERNQMLLVLNIEPDIDDPQSEAEEDDTPRADLRQFDRALYKTGSGYLDDARRSLWLLDLESGKVERLDSPIEENHHDVRVSPDGRLAAFTANPDGREFDGLFPRSLFLLDLESRQTRQLPTPDGRASAPVFSADSRALIYSHQTGRYQPQTLRRIHLTSDHDREIHNGQAVTVSDVVWPDNDRILFRADYQGGRPLFAWKADDDLGKMLIGERASITAYSLDGDGQAIAYLMEDEQQPAELWFAGSVDQPGRRLTDFNRELLEQTQPGALEPFWFTNEAGNKVQGFLLPPHGFDADAWQDDDDRQPLVLNIKGGPAGMWGHQWFHEFHMLASRGYAVAFTNYRGSTGYGYEFQHAVHQDYGGVDYRDNMLLLDEVLSKYPWLDPDALFITGGSHGGFLTNWIITRTDRFRAAVTQRSVSNWVSEAGTQAYVPDAMNEEFGGSIWQRHELYWQRSPLKYADKVSTPTRIIHSDADHITPIGQGQEWYFALLNNGVETELALFQGEGHGLSRSGTPVNLVKRLELIIDWFDRYRNQ